MNIEIVEEPIRFHLHGIEGVVESEWYRPFPRSTKRRSTTALAAKCLNRSRNA
jgi:hypothetical protein